MAVAEKYGLEFLPAQGLGYGDVRPTLRELARSISDKNFRLFAERGLIHVVNANMFLQGDDSFELFARMNQKQVSDHPHCQL